jgi:CubicO group peptidase (beta-lactamase class C family)
MAFPLATSTPSSLGFDVRALERLPELITRHLAEGRYPGAQIAVARQGKLALVRSFGDARIEPARVPARDDSLWLLYSNTKVITACAVWILAEQGALRFPDRVADHVPGFEANGKGDITIIQLLSHQGGFPNADVPKAAWEDHELLRRTVSAFTLEWTPGSRVYYHGRAAHWVAAVLIEALSKTDYRAFIREQVIEPLGLGDELFVGLPDARHERAVDMHEPAATGAGQGNRGQVKREEENNAEFRRAGTPGGGGYATARAMAAFYQMLAAGGALDGRRLLSPRMVQYVTRSVTGDRVDGYMGMPMHRALGPHVRGTTESIRGLGSLAFPGTFGHGGVGSSYCWADPDSGVSFAYLTNGRVPDPWHSMRMDVISNAVHSAIPAGR